MTPRWTPADLDAREDSARDLAQTEAANRWDAADHWDGHDDHPNPSDYADLALTPAPARDPHVEAAIERHLMRSRP